MEEDFVDSLNTMSVNGGTSSNIEDEKIAKGSENDDESDTVEDVTKDTVESSEDDDDSHKDESTDDKEKEKLLRQRQDAEDKLTDEEKAELRGRAQELKESGNSQFKQQCYTDAIETYTEALSICPLCYIKERSIMYSNRAAAYMHMDKSDDAIKDCTEALTLHPHYPKPLLRRAQTYEKTDKLDEALEDYKRLLELDSRSAEALSACQRLPKQIEERNEKLKTEMLGKLKDLGNLVLRPFGLSTNNFNLQQNDNGGYSVNFTNS